MTNTRAEAFAPATMANIGVGFDILGLAISGVGDTVIAEWGDGEGAQLTRIEGDGGKLPFDAAQNVTTIAANAVLRQVGYRGGVRLSLLKGLPLASGLGSSAASAVAGAVAVNALLGEPLTREALLPACLEGEAAVSGYHADNVAPSLFGGITLTTGVALEDIQRLPVPLGVHFAFITPNVEVRTAEARAVLPAQIPLKQMIHQTGMVARLVDAIYRNDLQALALAMEGDVVVEPARAHLMPYLYEARALAKANGALALVISGAGPTLCAVCEGAQVAQTVLDALQAFYGQKGLQSSGRVAQIAERGATVKLF